MNEFEHQQRMDEILHHEQDYRQRGIENMAQAHDDIDYLYTRINSLLRELEACSKAKARQGQDHDRN